MNEEKENHYQPIAEELENLVIVPGHAIYIGKGPSDPFDKEKWLGTYNGYRDNDEVPNYVEHIMRGIKHAVLDNNGLLVFSGGLTRKNAPFTEAQSYYNVAKHFSMLDTNKLKERIRLEQFATDSFENIIFSMLLFRMLHPWKNFPKKVTVVGLAFKKERYEFHCNTIKAKEATYTIRNPKEGTIIEQFSQITNFDFVYDAVNDIPDYLASSLDGEKQTLRDFKTCPFGDAGKLLEKRQVRDPYSWYCKRPYTVLAK